MKKVISGLLAMVMLFCLCACAPNETGGNSTTNYDNVKRELVGTWTVETNATLNPNEFDPETFYLFISYRFESDGTLTAHSQLIHKTVGTVDSKTYTGTYTIQDGVILLKANTNDTLQYTYQNGRLSVYTNDYTLTKK